MPTLFRSVSAALASVLSISAASPATPSLPPLEEAVTATRDVWGEAAIAQPNGPSYEFLAPLLPPPRYVHADFRHYPIILCPPGEIPAAPVDFRRGADPSAKPKARLISDGSGLNLRGGSRSWHDIGVPVRFRVGPDEFAFGGLRDRVTEPVLAEGWLPIPEIRYAHRSPVQSEGMVPLAPTGRKSTPEIYRLEAFASTAPGLAANCVVFIRLDLAQGTNGFLSVDVEAPGARFEKGSLLDAEGRVIALFDDAWKRERGRMVARVREGNVATLAVPTSPLPASSTLAASPAEYTAQRAACVATWRALVDRAARVEVPEPLVNHAWRNAIVQNFQLINHGQLRYSTGNQYDQIYSAEGSDAILALLSWGYAAEARRLMEPIFDFSRRNLELHQASFKLGNLVRYVRQTRDTAAITELRPQWEKEIARFLDGRTGPGGLFPKEQYCGDIHTPVQSLNVNSKAWRAMHELGALMTDFGDPALGRRYTTEAAAFRPVVLQAIDRVTSRTTEPPFVPIALDGGEPVHSPILHYRIGSYWNIIIGYSIGSGIFPAGSEQENWIPHYQERHGGIFLGMVRSGGDTFNFWTGPERVNPLYGTRYTLDALRRDEPERALLSLYGTLAQGLTRNTFVGGEGCTLRPVDGEGRFFYCPPNSAASAHVLSMVRHLLVQEWDLDDDGRPDTLRLLFGTSRRWLEDGKTIRVERAPTVWGEVGVTIESRLSAGEVVATVDLPSRQTPARTLLRTRVPDGWTVTGASVQEKKLATDPRGTVELTGLSGRQTIRFAVSRR